MPGFATIGEGCFPTKMESLTDACGRYFSYASDGSVTTCLGPYQSSGDFLYLQKQNGAAISWIDFRVFPQTCELLADVVNATSIGTAFITGFAWTTSLVSIAWIVGLAIQMIRKA